MTGTTLALALPTASPSSTDPADLGGIAGAAARVMTALGEVGVGICALAEVVFPPIPSEVILPFAGFLAFQGSLNVVLVLLAATLGSFAGAVVLYLLGRRLGEDRAVRLLARLPLVDESDFRTSADWLRRHGRGAVFFGRLVPLVRSLISLPAGATRMPFGRFALFTLAGTLLWNSLLVGAGFALGTQYHLVERYTEYLDVVIYAAVGLTLAWLIVRRVRRSRARRGEAE
ncbi:DedA family protein [Leifsonia shinshuensis]|uniref:DedA family protein n=1 Tax=Leifsonia shinshuensis TaxID=150026 RepID=UPI00285DD589|nr:DedA family protein [Leifsonia shinshuensis]MDR6971769.1 membrane protein DedA with SNARE-associated domain [Leifsonia shinshuensis]